MSECPRHNDPDLGYNAWHEDAARRHKAGQRQVQCPDCSRWVWPEHFVKEPRPNPTRDREVK